jgi:hypothetical protein
VKIVGLLLSNDFEVVRKVAQHAHTRDDELVICSADYDYFDETEVDGIPIRAPMDYLAPSEANNLYHEIYAWQSSLLAQRTEDGRTLQAASSPDAQAPSIGAWIFRFFPHMHVRVRFIEFIVRLIEKEKPDVICPIGISRNQPWMLTLLDRVAEVEFPNVKIEPPVAMVDPSERLRTWLCEFETASANLEQHVEIERARVTGFINQYKRSLRRVASHDFTAGEELPAKMAPAKLLATRLADDGTNLDQFLTETETINAQMMMDRNFATVFAKVERRQQRLEQLEASLAHKTGTALAKVERHRQRIQRRRARLERKIRMRGWFKEKLDRTLFRLVKKFRRRTNQ